MLGKEASFTSTVVKIISLPKVEMNINHESVCSPMPAVRMSVMLLCHIWKEIFKCRYFFSLLSLNIL